MCRAGPVVEPHPAASRDRTARVRYSTAFTMSSMTFFASPNTIIVLSM